MFVFIMFICYLSKIYYNSLFTVTKDICHSGWILFWSIILVYFHFNTFCWKFVFIFTILGIKDTLTVTLYVNLHKTLFYQLNFLTNTQGSQTSYFSYFSYQTSRNLLLWRKFSYFSPILQKCYLYLMEVSLED